MFTQWIGQDVPEPYGSYGNRAAMRVSPVAYLNRHETLENVFRAADRVTAITHDHPVGMKCARATVQAIWLAAAERRPTTSVVQPSTSTLSACRCGAAAPPRRGRLTAVPPPAGLPGLRAFDHDQVRALGRPPVHLFSHEAGGASNPRTRPPARVCSRLRPTRSTQWHAARGTAVPFARSAPPCSH